MCLKTLFMSDICNVSVIGHELHKIIMYYAYNNTTIPIGWWDTIVWYCEFYQGVGKLQRGGAIALALHSSDTQIQKIGWHRGATFKEYLCANQKKCPQTWYVSSISLALHITRPVYNPMKHTFHAMIQQSSNSSPGGVCCCGIIPHSSHEMGSWTKLNPGTGLPQDRSLGDWWGNKFSNSTSNPVTSQQIHTKITSKLVDKVRHGCYVGQGKKTQNRTQCKRPMV